MKQVTYGDIAAKSLRGLPANLRRLIVAKVEQYATNPTALANQVKKLQGRSGYRLRVGDWRVIFIEDATQVTVLEIGGRGGIYK